MKALITGANGFVGSHLTKFLAEKGIETIAYILKGTDHELLKILYPSLKNVKIVEGNVLKMDSLRINLKDVDFVFHLAGVIRGYNQEDFDRINVIGTKNIIQACIEVNPDLKRLIIVSSQAAAGPGTVEDPVTEDRPAIPLLNDYYGISKYKMECHANNCLEDLPISIVRPTAVFGAGDRVSLDLFKTVQSGVKVFPKGHKRQFSIVDVDDLIEGIYKCATNEKAIGETFYFACNGTIAWDDLHEIVAMTTFGKKYGNLLSIPIPIPIYKLAVFFLETIFKLLKKSAPFLNKAKIVQSTAISQVASAEKAKKILNWTPKQTIISTIAREGKWIKEQGWI